jgi:hypothetical protein
VAILALPFMHILRAFIDPGEVANSLKLVALQDYFRIFSDPVTLPFGQGLGAYYDWSVRGPFYITELTYLEMARNFGLPGALIMLALLLFPIGRVFFAQSNRSERSLAMAYFLSGHERFKPDSLFVDGDTDSRDFSCQRFSTATTRRLFTGTRTWLTKTGAFSPDSPLLTPSILHRHAR